MPGLLTYFLTAVTVSASMSAQPPLDKQADAVEIFHCTFDEENWDVNYDGWPDRWERAVGRDYPHYVEMAIVQPDDPHVDRCLEVRLDGARARVSSPPIRVLPKFSYALELKLKTEAIEHSSVRVVVDFMSDTGQVVQSHRSDPYGTTGEWVDVRLGKYRPMSHRVDRAVVRLEVDRDLRGDLHGVVSIADVWLGRLPSMEVTTDSQTNVYDDPNDVVVTCTLSGISEQNPLIKFQLLDATQAEIGEEGAARLQGRVIMEDSRKAHEFLDGDGKHSVGFEGATKWRPDIAGNGGFGFYRVRVTMISSVTHAEMDEKVITLVVVPKAITQARGEMGWTLPESVPRLGEPLSFEELQDLLPMAGVSWVKVPVWFPADEPSRADEIIQFAERLAAQDVETIGVIQPPDETPIDSPSASYASDIAFTFDKDPSVWSPLFEHVMNRLSLRLRWWQLGLDHDTGFVGYEDLVKKIDDIRRQLFRFGQDVRVGLGWRWDTPPLEGPVSWDFEQLSANPPLQSDQLAKRLAERPPGSTPRWVLIEPVVDDPSLTTVRERHEARVREFIKQIVIAKQHGVDGVFVPHPFSGPEGVMNADGTPGELLLPWRTASSLLGGAEYLGDLSLPSGSRNWLFLRQDGQVVMVVWNDEPGEEVLYLGDEVQCIDVWGKAQRPEQRGQRQVIPVGPTPKFVLGVNEWVARWRMSVAFEQTHVPSVFGVEHANAMLMHNAFPQGVGGECSIFVPDLLARGEGAAEQRSDAWKIPRVTEFKGAAGEQIRREVLIELKDAAVGVQPVRIDFEIMADQRYRFSVWRELTVGVGDIAIDVQTKLDEQGRLIVHQQMSIGSGRPTDFKCFLYAPLRRRKRTQVFQLGEEIDHKTYVYTNGEELVGAGLKLRMEELDGERVLIYRFLAEQ